MHSTKLLSRQFFLAGCFALLLALQACVSHPPSITQPANLEERSRWVDKTLARLTLEEKIAQMIMSRAYGYYTSSGSDEFRRLERLVKKEKVGGLIFFQGDVLENAVLVNRLQQMADVPLLIASDFEWGAAMRIRRATRFPEAMAVGATRDTALAYEMGQAIGEESRAIGVQLDFAPVADVNVNPDNPVINIRSFGEDPVLVAEMSSCFSAGLQSSDVFATAKHFPGHGDTQVDSHLELPLIEKPRSRLDSVELYPFRRLIDRGISAVMVAHIEVPSLQAGQLVPATLSPAIISKLLKEEFGFRGLVVTDAMDMGALVNLYGADSAAVKAVEAGVDILLIPTDEDATLDAIVRSVKSGRIPEQRIDQSAKKILEAKWTLGLTANRFVDLAQIPDVVESPLHLALAKKIAREAVTVLRNNGILPLERFGARKILNVIVADVENYRTEINRPTSQWPNETVGDYFTSLLRKRYSAMETVHVDPTSNSMELDSVMKRARRADILLCPVFSKVRSGSGKFGLPPALTNFVDSLNALKSSMIVIAMGSPYIVDSLPNADAYVCSYSDCEASTDAVVEALFGEIPTHGKLPVTIPKMFAFGSGIDLAQSVLRRDSPEAVGFIRDGLAAVDSIIAKAISDSAFPGAQVLVAKEGAVVYNKSFGALSYASNSPRVTASTMYDLASLTKVIATTAAVMRLLDEGKLNLGDTVGRILPEFANHGKETIRIRNLLLHNAGLPPFKRLYLTCKTPQEALDSVFQSGLIYNTGDSTVYSDFGFIVLGKVVERLSGMPLDAYVRKMLYAPLGMDRTMFTPPRTIWNSVAPTELDTIWRMRLLQGTVHDETAELLGGVSGHAGLFSDASDLAIFMQMLMNGGSYAGVQYLKPETVRLFTTKQVANGTRAFGWDLKTMHGYSTAGTLFGEESFGHTGFTGTSVWVDPGRKIFVILLTNRVYPTRNNNKIQQIRPAVADAVVRAMMK